MEEGEGGYRDGELEWVWRRKGVDGGVCGERKGKESEGGLGEEQLGYMARASYPHPHTCSRYNNKTSRIDDIDWDKTPQNTFTTPQGEVSFVDYYRRVCTLMHVYVNPSFGTVVAGGV